MKTARCINGFPKPFKLGEDHKNMQFYLYIRHKESVYKKKRRAFERNMHKINKDFYGYDGWGRAYSWKAYFIYTNEPINKETSFEKFVKDLSFILNGE